MAATLQLTDGTTTLNFDDSGNYKLLDKGWSPRRARRKQSLAGSPFEDVREEWQIRIDGSSETDALSSYDSLSDLLDQADQWGRGEVVTAVQLKLTPSNSTTTVQSVIWDSEIDPPTDVAQLGDGSRYRMAPIRVSFMRRGLWLSPNSESKTAAASSGNPAIITATTFTTAATTPSPFDVKLTYSTAGGTAQPMYGDHFYAFSNNANKFVILEGESRDGDGGNLSTTSVGIAGYLQSGGQIAQGTGAASYRATWDNPSFNSTARGIYALVATHTSGVVRNLYLRLNATAGGAIGDLGTSLSEYHISRKRKTSDSSNPQLIIVGPVFYNNSLNDYAVSLISAAVDSSSYQWDLDYIALIAVDENTNLLYVPNLPDNYDTAGTNHELYIEHRLDSDIGPAVYLLSDDANFPLKYPLAHNGNGVMTFTGNELSLLVVGHAESAGAIIVAGQDNPNDVSEANIAMTVTKTHAYLTPQ